MRLPWILCFLMTALGTARPQSNPLTAYQSLQRGRVDEAAILLQPHLGSAPNDASAHQLMCRVDYALERSEGALDECRKAAALAPQNGEDQLWLGRALGMQAERANKLAAFALARQVGTAFERAAQFNPNDVHALTDLGQFYIAAPGIVGGGTDKARGLAVKMASRFGWQSHWLLGLIAIKDGDLTRAERELRDSVAAGGNAESQINLALFFQQHGRLDEAAATIERASLLDRTRGPVLVDAASILIDAKRLPELAERLLRAYLVGEAQTDAAPTFKVHLQLGKLLVRKGDFQQARQEFTASLALAAGYVPAQEALQAAGL